MKQPDGFGIANSIVEQLKSWNIQGSQIEGGSFEGQYLHLNVPGHLNLLDLTELFKCAWDPLHKGCLVGVHIRAAVSFTWLIQIQSTCREIYTMFNWGKNYGDLIQVCGDSDTAMKSLANFQTTRRLQTGSRFVSINLRMDTI